MLDVILLIEETIDQNSQKEDFCSVLLTNRRNN